MGYAAAAAAAAPPPCPCGGGAEGAAPCQLVPVATHLRSFVGVKTDVLECSIPRGIQHSARDAVFPEEYSV